jgi:hypothetical protein
MLHFLQIYANMFFGHFPEIFTSLLAILSHSISFLNTWISACKLLILKLKQKIRIFPKVKQKLLVLPLKKIKNLGILTN